MRAKPDCTGQRFGLLKVLGKDKRIPKQAQLWILQCDCGNIVKHPRSNFDRKIPHTVSCGCRKKLASAANGRLREKPDIAGQRFGFLTVLGKGESIISANKVRQLWNLQCDCGRIISKPRGDFDRNNRTGQTSCGCRRKLGLIDNKRRPHDLTGQIFGSLTAIALCGTKHQGKPGWLMQCACGNQRVLSFSRLRSMQYYGLHINCGDREKHLERWLTYPPVPSPYPEDAGKLLVEYLYLTTINCGVWDEEYVHSQVEDLKRDRLIRACWILSYRRSQGEVFTEKHEKAFLYKHLQYCSVDIFWQNKLEEHGGILYDNNANIKKKLGNAMTDLTLLDYPTIETVGENILLSKNSKPVKRFKFNRR